MNDWSTWLARGTLILGTLSLGTGAALIAAPSAAQAQSPTRIALVIGSSSYSVLPSHLTGAEDARDMALVLRARGYEVIDMINRPARDVREATTRFMQRARNAEHALVFFSGHSVGRDRDTIPLSTDAANIDDQSLADILGARALAERLQQDTRSALVLVDGCQRDITLDDRSREPCLDPGVTLAGPSRFVMAMAGPAPSGLVATKGRNGFFTAALLRQLSDPGKDFTAAIEDAKVDVLALSKDQQNPWVRVASITPGTTLAPLPPSQQPTTQPTITPASNAPIPPAAPTHAAIPRYPNATCDTAPNQYIYCASSVLAPQQNNTYRPSNLFDDKADTAWVEGAEGDGVGQGFTIDLRGVRRVTGFSIRNGYTKSPDLFVRNGRVKTATLLFSTGARREITLKDQLDVQAFRFEAPIEATWVQFTINTVSKGSRHTDTAVTQFLLTVQ
jgi:hypothetical protein